MSVIGSLVSNKRRDPIKLGRADFVGNTYALALGATAGGGGNFPGTQLVPIVIPYDCEIEGIAFNNVFGANNNWAIQLFINQTVTPDFTHSFSSSKGFHTYPTDIIPGAYQMNKGDRLSVYFKNNHATASLGDVVITLYIRQL